MKVINTFESISTKEVSSVYNLQPIGSSSVEIRTNCLTMKEVAVAESRCIASNESHIQINGQLKLNSGETEVSDTPNHDGEKCMNFTTKKMFENVDLNSSSLTSKKNSWESTSSLLDTSNEKENVVNSNGLLYDPISDDESIMLHLSDDEFEKSPAKDKAEGESTESSEQNGMREIEMKTQKAMVNQDDGTEAVCKSKKPVSRVAVELIPHKDVDSVQEDNSDADVDNTEPLSSEKLAVLVDVSDKDYIVSIDRSNTVENKEEGAIMHEKVCSFSTTKTIDLQSSNMCLDISNGKNILHCCQSELDNCSRDSVLTELAAKVTVKTSVSNINISSRVDKEEEKKNSFLKSDEPVIKNNYILKCNDSNNDGRVNVKVTAANMKPYNSWLSAGQSQKKNHDNLQSDPLILNDQGTNNVSLKHGDHIEDDCNNVKEGYSNTSKHFPVMGGSSNTNAIHSSPFISSNSDQGESDILQSDIDNVEVQKCKVSLKTDIAVVKDSTNMLKENSKRKECVPLNSDNCEKEKFERQTENSCSNLQSEICATTLKATDSLLYKADDAVATTCTNIILKEKLSREESIILDDCSDQNRVDCPPLKTDFNCVILQSENDSYLITDKGFNVQLEKGDTGLLPEKHNCNSQSKNDTVVQEIVHMSNVGDCVEQYCSNVTLNEDSIRKESLTVKVDDSDKNKIVLSFLTKNSKKGENDGLQSGSNTSVADGMLIKTSNAVLKQCDMLDEDDSNEMDSFTLKIDGSDDKDIDSSPLQTDNSEEKYDASQSDSNDSLSVETNDSEKVKGNSSQKSDSNKMESIFPNESNLSLVINEAVLGSSSNKKNDVNNVDATNLVDSSQLKSTNKIVVKCRNDETKSPVKLDSNEDGNSNELINASEHSQVIASDNTLSNADCNFTGINNIDNLFVCGVEQEPAVDIYQLKSVDNSCFQKDTSNSHGSTKQELVKGQGVNDQAHIKGSGQVTTEMGAPADQTKPGHEEEERLRRKRASIQEDKTRVKKTKVSKINNTDLSSKVNDNNSEKNKDVSQEKEEEQVTGTNIGNSNSPISVSTSKRPSETHSGFIEVKKVRIMPEVERHLKEVTKKLIGNSTSSGSVATNSSGSVATNSSGNCSVAENGSKIEMEPDKAVPRKEPLSNLEQVIERVVAATSLPSEAPTPASANADSNTTQKKLNPMPFMRQLHHSQIKKLTRNDLEELVVQKLCEVVTERCQVGELRQRAHSLEQMLEQWRKKAMQLSKQVKDMEMVMKRFVNDQRSKKDRHVIPVKITRSVGLQVHLGQLPPLKLVKGRISDGNRTSQQQVRRRINRTIVPSATTSVATPQVAGVTPQSPVTVQKVVPPGHQKTATSSSISSPVVRQSSTMYANIQPAAAKTTQTSIKTIPSRSTVTTTTSGTTSTPTNMNPNPRLTSPTVTNRTIRPVVQYATHVSTVNTVKSGQDLKVIDLTDEEDRTKTNFVRNAVTAGSSILTSTAASIAPANSNLLTNPSVAGRGIRVVQPHQLTGTTATILAPSGTNTPSTGQRLAYFVPSTVGAVSQRQLLIATSTSQVRPGGVMSGSAPNRQNQLPAILFKSGTATVVPVAQGTGSPTCTTTILRTTQAISGSPLQQVLGNQRPNQAIRMPSTMVPMGRVTTVGNIAPVTVAASAPAPATSLAPGPMHPAPLPSFPAYGGALNINWKLAPPKPDLKISKVVNKNQQGIVLSWNMQVGPEHEEVASYQLYAYQESSAPPNTSLWKKVGDVKALPLPMACTLTQFMEGHKYHFAVRAIDVHTRCGPFSMPGNIVLTRK